MTWGPRSHGKQKDHAELFTGPKPDNVQGVTAGPRRWARARVRPTPQGCILAVRSWTCRPPPPPSPLALLNWP